jgi:DNA/RNA-binding protein KIN17
MGRAEAGSLKAMANKMKSKGLQKLRWYCQMCSKQCRDENGFKCHTASEGHLRQMRLFASNPNTFVDDFSKTFEKGYLETLSHKHGTKRTAANKVYQEYIQDKEHVHMNATCWSSLTGFCMYLGREGKAVVDETEKGWYIQYIDRDPATLARQAADAKRKQGDMDEAEYMRRMIEAQVAAAGEGEDDDEEDETKYALRRDEHDAQPIELSLKQGATGSSGLPDAKRRKLVAFDEEEEDDAGSIACQPCAAPAGSSSSSSSGAVGEKKLSAIEQLIADEESRKRADMRVQGQRTRTDHWLAPGIVVKVLNKSLLGGALYKFKARVVRVKDRYVGELNILPSSSSSNPFPPSLTPASVVSLDQSELETVIPKANQPVLILNGYGKGCRATLLRIDHQALNATVRIIDPDSPLHGQEVPNVEFEDICKVV